MQGGKLCHKIEFIRVEDTQNDTGATTQNETSFAFAMAEIRPVSGNERFISNQIFTEATSQINCRYIVGITTKHKIKFGDRSFDILNVQNKNERCIELLIIVKEIF